MTRLQSLTSKLLVTLLMGSGALATNLLAQTDDAITMNVPFSFTVGAQKLAPGTYQFRLPSSHFLLSVRNVKTGEMKMFNVHPEQERAVDQYGDLVFGYSGECCALNEVHFPGEDQFSVVIQQHGVGRVAARKSGDSIVVAQR